MWFSSDDLRTEAFDKLVEYNLPYEIKEIRDKVRQYFTDFEDDELYITATQIRTFMLNNNAIYNSTRITRNCETYLGVFNFKDETGEKKNKTCVYKWKIYVDTEGSDGKFIVKTDKQVGQPLVFKRENFVTVQQEQPKQHEIDFAVPKDKGCPF